MGRPRKYSDELRRRTIDEVLERGRKVPDVAKQLGITTPEIARPIRTDHRASGANPDTRTRRRTGFGVVRARALWLHA